MPTDPESFTNDLIVHADNVYWETMRTLGAYQAMRVAVAAALDTLFTEEPLRVPHSQYDEDSTLVSPRVVLDTILEEESRDHHRSA